LEPKSLHTPGKQIIIQVYVNW